MTIAAGSAPIITIEAEMRSGNKMVTKMTGLEVHILHHKLYFNEMKFIL